MDKETKALIEYLDSLFHIDSDAHSYNELSAQYIYKIRALAKAVRDKK